jgi:hypothetical protein
MGLQLGTGSPESRFYIRRHFHTGCVGSSILAPSPRQVATASEFRQANPFVLTWRCLDRDLKPAHTVTCSGVTDRLGPIIACNSLN